MCSVEHRTQIVCYPHSLASFPGPDGLETRLLVPSPMQNFANDEKLSVMDLRARLHTRITSGKNNCPIGMVCEQEPLV